MQNPYEYLHILLAFFSLLQQNLELIVINQKTNFCLFVET